MLRNFAQSFAIAEASVGFTILKSLNNKQAAEVGSYDHRHPRGSSVLHRR
jgi:hypothetical protein